MYFKSKVLKIFDLEIGIYLVIFSMPLYLWKFSIFSIPVNVLEIMIYVLFLVWLLKEIKKIITKEKSSKQHKNLFLLREQFFSFLGEAIKKKYVLSVGIILLFVGLAVSTALSSDLRTSLGIFKGWFIAPFLFFIVFINVIKGKECVFYSLKSWFFSGLVVSFISIFYLLSGNLTYDGRLKAFFLSPNHLAMYLAPATIIALSFLLKEKRGNKLLNFIALIIILIPLYFTYSYGAFWGIFVSLLYLTVKNKKIKFKNIYLSVLFLFLVVAFVSWGKFDQAVNSNDSSSLHSRIMIWNSAKEIIKDNPFLGIGPGTFQEVYLSYSGKFNEPYLEWAVPQPHNVFLAFYIQTGLAGFIGFMLILIWFFQKKNSQNPDSYIATSLMIYTLIHGLVDTTYWKNDLALMFWAMVALKVATEKSQSEMGNKKSRNKLVNN